MGRHRSHAGRPAGRLPAADRPEQRAVDRATDGSGGGRRRHGAPTLVDARPDAPGARCSSALGDAVPDDAVIAVDVGNNTYAFGHFFECHGRQDVLMSGLPRLDRLRLPGGDGRLGRGRRYAAKVVAVTGDGGFGQYLAEFTTAVKYGMPLTHVLLNNGELGKISREQISARSGLSGRPTSSTPTSPHSPRAVAAADFASTPAMISSPRSATPWRSPTGRHWWRYAAPPRRCSRKTPRLVAVTVTRRA